MSTHRRFLGLYPASLVGLASALVFVAACGNDSPVVSVAPTQPVVDDNITICQFVGGVGYLATVPHSTLTAHTGKGDYLAQLFVDNTTPGSTDGIHFKTITAALAAARTTRQTKAEKTSAGCPITISVASGTYKGSVKATSDTALEHFPLMIDMPGIALIGALTMGLDKDGRATGVGVGSGSTTLQPTAGLLSIAQGVDEPIIIVNGHPGGFQGNAATIQGFVFQSGHVGVDSVTGGFGVLSVRVVGMMLRGNRFEPAFTSAIDLRETSAQLEANHVSGGTVCDICLAGPGDYYATGNRVLKGGIDGILVAPVTGFTVPASIEPYVPPASASVYATVTNNDVRDHTLLPVGVAVRLATIGNLTPNIPTTSQMQIRGNTLTHNTFAVVIEAGFPLANTTLKGDADVTLADNTISQSCQANLFVTFTRHATALGAGQLTRPNVRNSTYNVQLGGSLNWDDAWYSYQPGLGDNLFVDGRFVGPGSRLAYDPAKTC